jgi:hypothetical protein
MTLSMICTLVDDGDDRAMLSSDDGVASADLYVVEGVFVDA